MVHTYTEGEREWYIHVLRGGGGERVVHTCTEGERGCDQQLFLALISSHSCKPPLCF